MAHNRELNHESLGPYEDGLSEHTATCEAVRPTNGARAAACMQLHRESIVERIAEFLFAGSSLRSVEVGRL